MVAQHGREDLEAAPQIQAPRRDEPRDDGKRLVEETLPLERQRVAIPFGVRVGCCEQNAGSSRERNPAQLQSLLGRARPIVARGDRVRVNVDEPLHGRPESLKPSRLMCCNALARR